MKNKIIRTLLIIVFLPGCALFTAKEDSEKACIGMVKELKEEIALQRVEIRELSAKVKTLENNKSVNLVSKVLTKKTKKAARIKTKEKKLSPLPSPEEATIADSSHEELHKYFKGVQLVREKKYDDGIRLLSEFISENPDHIYADRAEMLIADTHLNNKDYGLVVVSTNVLENRYPHSIKLPEALYKRATAFLALDQKEQAKRTLEKIMNDYPKSGLAEIAAKKMALIQTSKAADTP